MSATTALIISCLAITMSAVPISEFFPFGSTANDQVFPANDDGSTNALPLPGIFPYFNNNHQQIYLANNGLFSFLGPISQFVPTPFPLDDNRRLVAGFWSDIDTRGNISSGNQVYYHIYNPTSNGSVFDKAASYVQQYFPGERVFNPHMVITGTWYRVGAYSQQTSRVNTFQIVLVTDEIRSFAFLLYHDLQWASPQSSINSTGGQAGFNAGDGFVFQMLPYSRTDNVRLLANISNVNVPGLFVFRIDTDTIATGGCGNNSNLFFRPRRGSQLGSTAVTVQGPCFTNTSVGDVKCRFGDSIIVDAVVIDELRAMCLTSAVPLPSIVQVYLSIDAGNTFLLLPGTFTYTPAEYGHSSTDNAQVILLNHTNIFAMVGDQLTLGWFLSDTTMNYWPNNTIRFEVQMYRVTMNESSGGIIQNTNTNIILKTNIIAVIGYQSTSIIIPPFGNYDLSVIFFRIVARDNLTRVIYGGFNSALLALRDNTSTVSGYCQSWASAQPLPTTWNQDLLLCPLTLTQARVARCCYEPDPSCIENSYEPLVNCQFRRGRPNLDEESAIACYLSRSTNQWNAGAECCYDATGQLITRGTGGGTDDRYRPASYPVLHLFSDTLPFLACCLFSTNEESCTRYFNLRPHRQGSNSPNSWGGAWGDPHFTTLDGSAYTFNGYGEYTYLAISDASVSANTPFNPETQTLIFNAQVRTTPLLLPNGTSMTTATVIRGLAAKSHDPLAQNMSVTVSRRELLIVRRGNENLDLDSTSDDSIASNTSLVLYFPEMTLQRNRTSGVLTLSWFIGVSIQITPILINTSTPSALVLNIGVSVAGSHQNCTFGLLGSYDNNPTNDLQAQNGTVIGVADTLTLEQIHRQFGQTWAINSNRSLFYYEPGSSASFYANQNLLYAPLFSSPEPPTARVNMTLAACNIDPSSTNRSTWSVAQETCYYDIAMTNDISLGRTSLAAADTIVQIRNDQRSPPEFSSNLPLIFLVNRSTLVNISFTAISPYTSQIFYTLLQGPPSGRFDNQTALFQWQMTSSADIDTIVRVSARDAQYSLISTQEITIRAINSDGNSTLPSSRASQRLGMSEFCMVILLNILGIVYIHQQSYL